MHKSGRIIFAGVGLSLVLGMVIAFRVGTEYFVLKTFFATIFLLLTIDSLLYAFAGGGGLFTPCDFCQDFKV